MTDQVARTTQQVLRLFDAKAMSWHEKYAPDGRLAGRLVHMAGAIGPPARPGARVLDLGCATGELARYLGATGWQVTGADISPEMLSRASTADTSGAVEWARLDPGWRALPFAPWTFDAIVASSVLEYVDDPADVLCECARVLRPGGALLITVPDMRHPVRWAERAAALAVRLPLARTGLGAIPRLRGYVAYLRVSRQRHLLRWWQVAAGRAGLCAIPAAGERRLSPLRTLAFRRQADRGGTS